MWVALVAAFVSAAPWSARHAAAQTSDFEGTGLFSRGAAALSGFGALADTAAGDSLTYTADEISYDVDAATITLVGGAAIRYGAMTLAAHHIRFIVDHDLVIAEGHADPANSDSILGLPRFSNGAESFAGERMVYNIRTQRGVVEGGSSAQPEGIYAGHIVKRTGDQQLDVYQGVYTTCTHNPSHYEFEATHMRIMVGDKVIAQPVVMKVAGVPILWLPFGVFFVNKDRRSGFLSPRLGENSYSGRYMRGLGYYWAPSEYFGAQAVLDLDERVGYEWRAMTNYAWRYRLNGALATSYTRYWGTTGQRTWNLSARHQQELSPRSSLNANINYTSSETPLLTPNTTQASILRQTFTSTGGYTRSWESGYSLRLLASSSKDLQTQRLDQVLPSLSIGSGQRLFFPTPERSGRRGREAPPEPPWYRQLGYSWSWTGQNSRSRGPITNDIYDTWTFTEHRPDSAVIYLLTITSNPLLHPDHDGLYSVEIEDGPTITQGLVRATSDQDSLVLVTGGQTIEPGWAIRFGDVLRVKLPGIAGEQAWQRRRVPDVYSQTTRQGVTLSLPLPTPRWLQVRPSLAWNAVWNSHPREDDPNDPNAEQTLSAGIGASATLYGLFPINLGPIVAVRHVFTPSVSASYNLSRWTRGGTYLFGGRSVGGDTSRVLAFDMRNIFQLKMRRGDNEIRLDRLLTVSTGARYNPDAERRRWSDVVTSIQIEPSDLVVSRISFTHGLYDDDDRLRWRQPMLRSFDAVTSLRLAGGGTEPAQVGEEGYVAQRDEPLGLRGIEAAGDRPQGRPAEKVWRPGWQVNLRHSYQWIRPTPGAAFQPEPRNQMDVAFGLSPTPNWRIDGTTTYDIAARRRYGDAVNITRKLHCWEATLDWVIRGPTRGYYFRICAIGLPEVKIEAASDQSRAFR